MSLRTKYSANTHRYLAENNLELSKSRGRSNGAKLNCVADDHTPFVISEQMRTQVAGLEQAMINSEAAIALVRTIEGAYTEIIRILISMRQLAVHAVSEVISVKKVLQRDQEEVEEMIEAINQISTQTQFRGKILSDEADGVERFVIDSGMEPVKVDIHTAGSATKGYGHTDRTTTAGGVSVTRNAFVFRVKVNADQTVDISTPDFSARTLGRGIVNNSGFKSLSDINLLTASGVKDSLLLMDNAINEVVKNMADLASIQKDTLELNLTKLRVAAENITAANSTVHSADITADITIFIKDKVANGSSAAILSPNTENNLEIID